MDRHRASKLLLAALAIVLAALLGAAPSAHAGGTEEEGIEVLSTKPVDGDVLTATPVEIVLNFKARLPAITPIVQLQNERRELQNVGQPVAINNRMGLRVRLRQALPAGDYTVTYLIRPTNGKELTGEFQFTLEAPTATTVAGEAGATTTTQPEPDDDGLGLRKSNHYNGWLGTLGRLLAFVGLGALAGGLLLIATSWAEGVEYVLTVKHFWAAWGLAVIGCLLTVGTAASDINGISIARAFVPTEWDDLLKTTFGKAVVIRLAAVIGCAWVAARPERVVDRGTQLMALGVPAIALATYGWSRDYADVSNAAIPAGIIHAMAGAAWFGGAALLTRVVLAGPGDEDLVQAVRGFRRIYLPAALLVVVSGAIETNIYLGGLGKITSSSFGRIFVLKILAVLAMAFVATANRQYARHRLARARHLDARPAARLRQSVRTEVMAGTVVFLLAAWLGGTAAPGLAAEDPARINKDTYVSADGSFRADITFGPKRVGARVELHFRLKEPESIQNGFITLTPKDGRTSGFEIPIAGTPNYGFEARQGFVFGSSGTWIITIRGEGPDGDLPTITREFTVNNQDNSAPGSATTTPTTTTPEETSSEDSDSTDESDTTDAADTTDG